MSILDNNGINRWGDYSSTVVDPVNDTDFWTVQEYAGARQARGQCGGTTSYRPRTRAPALQSVSVNPAGVTGPQPSTGTVTLNMVTPAALSVDLARTILRPQVPASVTVAQNASSANFQITTNASPVHRRINLRHLQRPHRLRKFTVESSRLALQSVSVSPTTATGGHLVDRHSDA